MMESAVKIRDAIRRDDDGFVISSAWPFVFVRRLRVRKGSPLKGGGRDDERVTDRFCDQDDQYE